MNHLLTVQAGGLKVAMELCSMLLHLHKFTTDLIPLRPLLIFRLVRKIAKRDYLLRHVNQPAWNIAASNGQIFMKFNISRFF